MDRITIPNITFNTHNMTVSTSGSGTLSTFPSTFAPDKRPKHERFFGMTEDEIYKDNRVLKYEVFRNLNKEDIKVIMNELGNKINLAI